MSLNEKENLEDKTVLTTNSINPSKSLGARSKRPAQNLYIPKHLRNIEKKSLNDNVCIQNAVNVSNNGGFSNSPINDPSIIGYITDSSKSLSYSAEVKSSNSNQADTNDENVILYKLQTMKIAPEFEESKTDIIPEKRNDEKQFQQNGTKQKKSECDWFEMYDDLGQSLEMKSSKPTAKVETTESTKLIDYSKWEPQVESLDEEEYGHILEIYEFPVEFKNENIFSAIKTIKGNIEFDLKWVDDTHCLGVFSSSSVASTILKENLNPMLKTRPLSKATNDSKRRAQRLVSYLRPYKPRPQTTSFVASRLIGASLGLNSLIPKEKLKLERKKIDSARDTKRKDREIKDAVWNGKD